MRMTSLRIFPNRRYRKFYNEGFEVLMIISLVTSLSLCLFTIDPDSECLRDHGAQACGRRHPSAVQPAVRCLPWDPVPPWRDDCSEGGAEESLWGDVPHLWRR